MVVLVVTDLVINDYLGDDFAKETQAEVAMVADNTMGDPELRGDEEVPAEDDLVVDEPIEGEEQPVVEEPVVEAPVEDGAPIEAAPSGSLITLERLAGFDLLEPRLDATVLNGPVYGFWEVTDDLADFLINKVDVFDGSEFVSTVYEVQGENEIQTFAAYEALRQIGLTSPVGGINENNSYGDASFYFNHDTKQNTVFLIVRKGLGVYAFQYSHDMHNTFVRPLLDSL
jgi:hypothetical protein